MLWVSLALLAQFTFLPDSREIDRLIAQLGSERFVEREAATKALDRLGDLALERLRSASRNTDDPEIRRRTAHLVKVVSERVTCAQALAIRNSPLSTEEKGQKLRHFLKHGMSHAEAQGILGKDCFCVDDGKILIVHYRECDLWIAYYEHGLLVVCD